MSNHQNVSIDYDDDTDEFELKQGDDTIELDNRAAKEVILALQTGVKAQEKV